MPPIECVKFPNSSTVFYILALDIEKLVEEELIIKKFVNTEGQYETISVSLTNKSELDQMGIVINQLQYYENLKIYCLKFRLKCNFKKTKSSIDAISM